MKKSFEKAVAKMGVDELMEARNRIDRLLKTKKNEHKEKLRDQFAQIAEKSGFTLDEVLSTPSTRSRPTVGGRKRKAPPARKPRPPKYRHPNNSEVTWSGFGPRPRWVKEHLAAGKAIDDLLIK